MLWAFDTRLAACVELCSAWSMNRDQVSVGFDLRGLVLGHRV